MEPGERGQTSLRPRFPALDPEPPPRPWWHAALALLAVAAIAAAGFFVFTSPKAHTRAPVRQAGKFSGVVLAETSSGQLTLTDLRSGKVLRLGKLGSFPTNPAPAVSSDGKYLIAPALDELISLASPVAPVKVATPIDFSNNSNPGLLSPFADHDASMVLQEDLYASPNPQARTWVQSLRTGHTVPLGIADSRGPFDDPQSRLFGLRAQAAGDPQANGAFVAVAQSGLPVSIPADVRLELRDVGQAPRVLATSDSLKRLVGIKPGVGVMLGALPNPQGTMVAVEVQPIPAAPTGPLGPNGRPGQIPAGIVVLDRKGKVLDSDSAGFPQLRAATWSRSGTKLAFLGSGAAGPEVTEMDVGAGSATTNFPAADSAQTRCLWSGDATMLLCGDGFGPWTVLASGVMTNMPYSVPGRGLVLAWLDGRLAR